MAYQQPRSFDEWATQNPEEASALSPEQERQARTAVQGWREDPTKLFNSLQWLTKSGSFEGEKSKGLANIWDYHSDRFFDPNYRDVREEHNRAFATKEIAQVLTDRAKRVKGSGFDEIEDWFWGIHTLFAKDPVGFAAWQQANPEMAIRFHAQANVRGNTNDFIYGGNFDHNAEAQRLAYDEAQRLGYGTDAKKDGRSVVFNYDTVDDVSSEYGEGDFWKIGTPQKFTDGLFNFIEENPWKAAAAVASLAIPAAAPALASAAAAAGITMSPAMAGGILSSGLAAASGGDLEDVITAGLTTYGLTTLADPATIEAIVGNVDPKAAANFSTVMQETQTIKEGGDVVTGDGGLLGVIGDIYDQQGDGIKDPTSGMFDPTVYEHLPGTVPPEDKEEEGGGGGSSAQAPTPEEPVDIFVEGDPGPDESAEEGDTWRYIDGWLVNERTGQRRDVIDGSLDPSVAYNGDGDPKEGDEIVDINAPLFGDSTDDITTGGIGGGSGLGDGLGSGDGTGDGDGDGDGSGDGDGTLGSGQVLAGGFATGVREGDLFDLEKMSPAAYAILGPMVNHITGEYTR